MTTLHVDGREVVVDTTPLQVGAASFRILTLVQPRDGRLVLRPKVGVWLFACGFVFLGATLIVIGLVKREPMENGMEKEFWSQVVGGVAFSLLGILFAHAPRHKFDRDAGQWTASRFLIATSRPLTDVLAVQLVDGGLHVRHITWFSGSRERSYNSYQLNLVLDDATSPRRCLSNHGNRDATRRDGARLAEFLGVPLLDGFSKT